MRRGSVSAFTRRCGKPNCHCARPKDPGHGPQHRLTRSVNGKTVTETFAHEAERRKAQREVDEFHRFQQLGRELLAMNETICRLRPVEEDDRSRQKKTAAAIQQEVAQEVSRLLQVICPSLPMLNRVSVGH